MAVSYKPSLGRVLLSHSPCQSQELATSSVTLTYYPWFLPRGSSLQHYTQLFPVSYSSPYSAALCIKLSHSSSCSPEPAAPSIPLSHSHSSPDPPPQHYTQPFSAPPCSSPELVALRITLSCTLPWFPTPRATSPKH